MGASVADSGIPFLSQIEGEHVLNKETAKALEADARYNAAQRKKQGDQLMGEQIAAYGASGVELEGTPMELIANDRKIAEIEAMNIIYSGKVQANVMRRKSEYQKQKAYTDLGVTAVKLGGGLA